jgi:retron-type reverse transcriptase
MVHNIYNNLISLENILLCWYEFRKGKSKKLDVMEFERYLEDNIFQLHSELANQNYKHGAYKQFHIFDPKHRIIHKATVKDRLVHHIVFKELYKIFNYTFIYHSYSSRKNKGTHLAVKNLFYALRRASSNYSEPVYVLKCDIKKFFHSVSHQKLFETIKNRVKDDKFLWLIWEIISSFSMAGDKFSRKGLPIGNLSSQIFANIFLDEFDWFIKKYLKMKYYFRYTDDFIIVYSDFDYLKMIITPIKKFLKTKLDLEIHPQKIQIRKFRQGIDFLGYVNFPYYRILRAKTKRRMFKKIEQKVVDLKQNKITEESFNQTIQSYLGILKHCNGYKLKNEIINKLLF